MTVKMNSTMLHALTRGQLQALAKREVIRAVGKTEAIVRRLLNKHPNGVPMPEGGDNPSASSAPPKESLSKKTPNKKPPARTRAPKTSQNRRADPKGKGKAVAKPTSPSPSSSSEALEQLLHLDDEPVAGPYNPSPKRTVASPSRAPPETRAQRSRRPPATIPVSFSGARSAASPHQAPDPGRRTEEEEEETRERGEQELGGDDDGYYDENPRANAYSTTTTRYTLVDTLRQTKKLTDALPTFDARLVEYGHLLDRAQSHLETVVPDSRQLAVTREYLERFILGEMKRKREIWDGTGAMAKQDRKLRMAWIRERRKIDGEKRWREANEDAEKRGHEPAPLSTFIPESDEEDIESLLSTPASSRDGSPKRAREEDVDGESNADPDVAQSKKRARS